jgi:carbamoyltransferase
MEYDLTCYKGYDLLQPKLYTQKLVDMLGGREGVSGEQADEWHMKVAKAMQRVAEDVAIHMLNKLYEFSKSDNLAVAGGFFMNSVLNGKLLDVTPFKNVYIPYAPIDAGNSIGSALYVAHQLYDEPRWFGYNTSSIGPEYGTEEIESVLNRRKIRYEKVIAPEKRISELLSQGHIVAVMQGRMEFGERALGNRSILADPRGSEIKDKINSIIKYRESYRPFAPAVKQEDVGEYFEVASNFECNYMEKVVPIKKEYQSLIPAVTHVDGSGRVQTVSKDDNPFFYNVIDEFGKITGISVVLNTSFNINGEPIVLTADDAINTLYNSGLEYLFMNDCFISKSHN